MSLNTLFFPAYSAPMTMALAGIFQSVRLVQQLASQGRCDQDSYTQCYRALMVTDASSYEDIFGADRGMEIGLSRLHQFCQTNPESSTKNSFQLEGRYVAQVIQLCRLLKGRLDIQQCIYEGIQQANRSITFLGEGSTAADDRLASLYVETIGKLGFRMQIKGQPEILTQEPIAARIRVMLFSGVRFAHLWHEMGGHALHLVISRRRIAKACFPLVSRHYQ